MTRTFPAHLELFELHECVKIEIGSLFLKKINSVFDNFMVYQMFRVLSKYYTNIYSCNIFNEFLIPIIKITHTLYIKFQKYREMASRKCF